MQIKIYDETHAYIRFFFLGIHSTYKGIYLVFHSLWMKLYWKIDWKESLHELMTKYDYDSNKNAESLTGIATMLQ